jgi:predicted metal-dependent hydrolase
MDYELIRSARRTIALEVTREGSVRLRVPYRCSVQAAEAFLAQHADWVARAVARQTARRMAHPEPDAAARAALIARAKAELPGKVARYAAVMDVCPAGISITGAKTRFGSCSAKNRLSFSWRLMQYPEKAVDYVVVHELAHILEKNHSPAFYRHVQAVLPDWRERRALLRG